MHDFAEKSAAALLDDLTPEEQAEWDATLAQDPQSRALHEELTAMNDLLATHHADVLPASNFELRMIGAFRRRAAREPLARRVARWLRIPAVFIPTTAAMMAVLVWLGSALTREPAIAISMELPNPARPATPPAPANPAKVQQLLSEAQGFYNSGRYDLAQKRSEQALAIDTTNIAARRLTEDINLAREKYYHEARGETRTRMLVQTDSAWELPVTRYDADKELLKNKTAQSAPDKFGGFINYGSPVYTAANSTNGGSVEVFPNVINQPIFSARKTTAVQGPADSRKLVRNAGADLIVRAFDPAAQSIVDLATKADGYVATRDSSRLANGRMTGTIVVKIPPPALDSFLAQLAALGEVRNQSLGTEDVTKAYFDTEARLRNAHRMEDSLLDLLKNTKGKVSDLLEVERELGRVREQIEEMQGQLKLWDWLTAEATVTIRLAEKDLDAAAAYTIREQATLTLTDDDVEKSFQRAKDIAAENKAQIVQSNLTRSDDHRSVATLLLLLDAATADATIEQLKTLGRVIDFRRQAQRVARDGGSDAPNALVEHDRVQVTLTISSQDETPVQRTGLLLETNDVAKQAAALREYADAHKIEIKDSSFAQQPDGRETATLRLALPLAGYDALLSRIRDAGAVKDFSVQRNDAAQPGGDFAEVLVNIANPPKLVASKDGLAPTLRHTFGQAAGSLMWSLRMIGVALAFLAPWAAVLAIVALFVRVVRRRKKRI